MKFLLLLFLSGNLSAGQVPSSLPGLRALYHFNEGSGSKVKSEIVEATSLAVTGGTWVTGKFNTGMFFGGANKYAATANPISWLDMVPAGSMTAVYWIKRTANSATYETILSKRVSNVAQYEFGLETGTHKLYFWAGGTVATVPYVPPLNTWVLIAVSVTVKISRFYADGKYVGQFNGVQIGAASASLLWVGTASHTEQSFLGIVDEVALFNRALSSGEIARIYIEAIGRHSNAR